MGGRNRCTIAVCIVCGGARSRSAVHLGEEAEKKKRTAHTRDAVSDGFDCPLVRHADTTRGVGGGARYSFGKTGFAPAAPLIQLHEHGYEIHRGAMLIDEDTTALFENIPDEKFHVIFNNGPADDPCNDGRRLQMDLDSVRGAEAQSFHRSLTAVLSKLFPRHRVAGAHVLRCKAGCLPQRCHVDYCPEQCNAWDTDVPLACLVALKDHTFIDVWPGAIRFDSEKVFTHQSLELKRGDVLVFRGDLVHAGAAFAEENARIHCYLEPVVNFKRMQDDDGTELTYFMDTWSNILPRGSIVIQEDPL